MAIPFTAGLVSAQSGSVLADQNCDTWSVYVYLANNVTGDMTVDILTTIPGTTDLTDYHTDTTSSSVDTLIWAETGAAPVSGTVTLNIYSGSNLEFTQSKSLPAVIDCLPTATPTATPTSTPTATPTSTPTATPTATPTSTPPVEPPATPFQSIEGETGAPGQTATPPSTSTSGNGSGNNSTPLGALLISLALGSIGLVAVESQRRSVRR